MTHPQQPANGRTSETHDHSTWHERDGEGRAARVCSLRSSQREFADALLERLWVIRDVAPGKACALWWTRTDGDRIDAGYEDVSDPDSVQDLVARRGSLSLELFAPLASQTLAAFAPLHDRGIAVGIVKPSDLLLRVEFGRALVLRVRDLGWPVAPDDPSSGGGALRPPEGVGVCTGSDVYSLGVLFRWMLTGDWNARAEVAGPAELQRLLERMTAVDPADRPSTVNDVVEVLVGTIPPRLFALPREDAFAVFATGKQRQPPAATAAAAVREPDTDAPATGAARGAQRARSAGHAADVEPARAPSPSGAARRLRVGFFAASLAFLGVWGIGVFGGEGRSPASPPAEAAASSGGRVAVGALPAAPAAAPRSPTAPERLEPAEPATESGPVVEPRPTPAAGGQDRDARSAHSVETAETAEAAEVRVTRRRFPQPSSTGAPAARKPSRAAGRARASRAEPDPAGAGPAVRTEPDESSESTSPAGADAAGSGGAGDLRGEGAAAAPETGPKSGPDGKGSGAGLRREVREAEAAVPRLSPDSPFLPVARGASQTPTPHPDLQLECADAAVPQAGAERGCLGGP